jgi:hypothetical protein
MDPRGGAVFHSQTRECLIRSTRSPSSVGRRQMSVADRDLLGKVAFDGVTPDPLPRSLEGDHAWRQDVVHRQGERAAAGEGWHGGGWRGWFEAVRDQRLGTCGISSLPM